MSKKKKPGPKPALESIQVGLRMDSQAMVAALDALAKRQRRSRNSTLIAIVEAVLVSEGLWPPAKSK